MRIDNIEELNIMKNICNFNINKDIDFTIKKDFLRIQILVDEIKKKEESK